MNIKQAIPKDLMYLIYDYTKPTDKMNLVIEDLHKLYKNHFIHGTNNGYEVYTIIEILKLNPDSDTEEDEVDYESMPTRYEEDEETTEYPDSDSDYE